MEAERRDFGGTEWTAVILLPIGALLIPLLWLVGAAMLWISRVWTIPEKLLGTVLTALGVLWAPVLFVFFAGHDICTTRLNSSGEVIKHCGSSVSSGNSALAWTLFAIVVLTPIITAIVLRRRGARRARASTAGGGQPLPARG